ncbi:hypothetical protein ABW20_dc0107921 [Dactylellina cionopaga]|nr:hypothetical protein ABW20_dc0107921 [Dactylellina cionopaga]
MLRSRRLPTSICRHSPFYIPRRTLFGRRKKSEPLLVPQLSDEWHREVEQHPDLKRDPPQSVAILGAGITGLAAAHNLSRFSPETKITLLEASPRTGGWIRSHTIPTSDGSIIFEAGPRSLRPWTINGIITLNLIDHLGLDPQMLLVPTTSPAAKNRYIYFSNQLNKLPSSPLAAFSALRLPVLRGAVGSMVTEPFRRRRPSNVDDESVESFLTRRLGSSLTNNLASAVFHGIYAGDIANLSADTLLHGIYRGEKVYGSITWGALGVQEMTLEDKILRGMYTKRTGRLLNKIKGTSIYSFKGGMETLTKTLDANVLGYDEGGSSFDFVISTLSASKTAALLLPDTSDSLFETKGVTVMVVNLFYDKPNMVGYSGFGYLIPKSVPLEQNPHRALGVIFDSDAMPGQDEREGTKLTVMLGGHWWDGNSSFPSEEDGVLMAREVLQHHLGITEAPAETMATLQRDCIPQYAVGHAGRLRQVHENLMDKMGGKLVLAGNSYGGVGLNDCVRSGRDAAFGVAAGRKMTGLERWAFEETWVSRDTP